MDDDDDVQEVLALAKSADRDAALARLTERWDRDGIHVVRGRCVELLEASPPNTRSLLRALDLLDDVLD